MSLDYYAILGVSSSANTDEIKRSYRALALKWHPDKNPGHEREATEKFKEISEAFSVLSDEKKRRSYDRQGKANTFSDGASEFPRGFPQAPGGFGAFPNDFAAYHRQFTFANAFDIFRTVFGDNPFEHHNNMLRQMEQMHGMHLNAFARAPPPQAAPNAFAAMHSPFANDPFFSALAFPAAPLFPAGGFSSFSSSSSSSSSGGGGFGTQTSTVSSTDALGRQIVKRTVTKRSPDGGVEETTTTQIIRNGQIESEQTENRRTQGQRYLPSPTGTPTHSQLVQQQPQSRVRHIPVIETIDLTQESDSPQHATTLDSQFQQASTEAFPSRSSHTSSSHVSRNTSFPSSYTSSSPSTRLSASAVPFSPATSRPSPAMSFAQQNPPRYDFSVHSSSSRSSKF